MESGEISDYSDLTAGQYEGLVLKRERHYKWRPYWCVLYGRQLTFYEDRDKERVAGRIELQPGSHCDKGKAKMFPSLAELFHRDYSNMKKYPLTLKTKKGTHVFTYENLNERSRWQMAINNASQENANNVRLSWIPTPFSMVTTPTKRKKIDRIELCPSSASASPSRLSSTTDNVDGVELPIVTSLNSHEDTQTLIENPDSEVTVNFAFTNPYFNYRNSRELVTSL